MLVLLTAMMCGLGLLRMLVGRDPITDEIALSWPDAAYVGFRSTAMLVAAGVGGGLALSGMLLQAALRNPLASPSVLGVSSGAGLGVMVALYLAHQAGVSSLPWGVSAMLGACFAVGVVLALGGRGGWPDPVSTILAGVIVATMCGAGMVLLQGLVPDGLRGRFLAWAMGTIPESVPGGGLASLFVALAVVLVVAQCGHGRLDALLLDHASAVTIGAAPGPTRLACLAAAGTLTAITVALCGPLGFVGLVAPHVARRVIGPAHRLLVPASVVVGAGLVLGADVARQVVDFGTGRLPVGVLTTLAGGPIFLWMLRRGAASGWRTDAAV
ncbi:MAG: iron ABC transporter permease [Phycisphaerales bacterium]|nr:iron ABC transporter permease [Phycisphaerales bacterium]